MNGRTYNWITYFCALTAIACAVLFDYVVGLRWVLLAIGIGAAVGAAVFHFYNSWEPDNESVLAASVENSEPPELSLAKIRWRYPHALSDRSILARVLNEAEPNYLASFHREVTERQFHYLLALSKSQQEEFSKRIAHALSPLYDPEPTREIEMECVVTRDGSFVFVVRPVNKLKHSPHIPPVITYEPVSGFPDSGEWMVGGKLQGVITPLYPGGIGVPAY